MFGLSDTQMGDVGTGLGLVGSGISAFGQYQAGQQSGAAYDYNADLALSTLPLDEYRMDQQEVALGSVQRAAYAKAGVTMSGSPLDVMLKSKTNMELDKAINRYNVESKATMYEYQAKAARSQGEFNAGATLLSGAGTAVLGLALL